MERIIYIKMDLPLNNLQWLICHKTQPNPIQPNNYIIIKKKILYFNQNQDDRD